MIRKENVKGRKVRSIGIREINERKKEEDTKGKGGNRKGIIELRKESL